jgi:hypothetical protein
MPETIVPYMIAIGAQTYAMPALRLLRRDCMSEHLLLDGRVLVTWSKGRSSREQRRSFLKDKSFSVPTLIEQVLAMTAALIACAARGPGPPVPDRQYEQLADRRRDTELSGIGACPALREASRSARRSGQALATEHRRASGIWADAGA